MTLNTPLMLTSTMSSPVLDHGGLVARHRVAPVDAGVVDEDRDLADVARDFGRRRIARCLVRDVERHHVDGAAVAADALGRDVGGSRIVVENDDFGAFPGIAGRDRSTDPRGPAP